MGLLFRHGVQLQCLRILLDCVHNVSPEAWPQTHSSLYPAEGKGVGTATCKVCGGSLKGSEGLMAPQRQLSPEGVMHLTSRAALLLPEGKFVLENA